MSIRDEGLPIGLWNVCLTLSPTRRSQSLDLLSKRIRVIPGNSYELLLGKI